VPGSGCALGELAVDRREASTGPATTGEPARPTTPLVIGVATIRLTSEHADDPGSLKALLQEDLRRELWPN
jgi:hypothetical protein